ncbi:hypothetical protein BMS3Abin14_01044 [bacterium BMS3Abin14]|nr:hypothetical protein BMS3Abin14_01044 [bacterium BMS3Abin14]
MFYTKDHKTLNMFDPFEHLGPKRRKLLESSWAHLFRQEILPDLPVHKLTGIYSELHGRPTKELYAMLGLMIIQQMHDLTDDEAADKFAFDIQWQYALNVTGGSDEEAYISSRTLWSMRNILTEHNLYLPLFESVTDKLAKLFNIDTGKQRIRRHGDTERLCPSLRLSTDLSRRSFSEDGSFMRRWKQQSPVRGNPVRSRACHCGTLRSPRDRFRLRRGFDVTGRKEHSSLTSRHVGPWNVEHGTTAGVRDRGKAGQTSNACRGDLSRRSSKNEDGSAEKAIQRQVS